MTVVNIGSSDLKEGRPHLVLGLVWQLVKMTLLQNINLKDNPNLLRLLQAGEELEELLKLPPEKLLLRWFNYHLEQASLEADQQLRPRPQGLGGVRDAAQADRPEQDGEHGHPLEPGPPQARRVRHQPGAADGRDGLHDPARRRRQGQRQAQPRLRRRALQRVPRARAAGRGAAARAARDCRRRRRRRLARGARSGCGSTRSASRRTSTTCSTTCATAWCCSRRWTTSSPAASRGAASTATARWSSRRSRTRTTPSTSGSKHSSSRSSACRARTSSTATRSSRSRSCGN